MTTDNRPTCEEVLDAFSVEPNPDRATLEHYLCTYPEYAESLIDLSLELNRFISQDEMPLSMRDISLIEAALANYRSHDGESISDPFVAMLVGDQRTIAKQLDVPRQVLVAFRERRVLISSVPQCFLDRMARSMNISPDILCAQYSGAYQSQCHTRAYKAIAKPNETGQVSFERLLIDAGVPEDKRAELLSDGD